RGLASAHEVDDLEGIVGCELHHRKGRAVAENGSVALDNDNPRVEAERRQQVRHRRSNGNTPLVAVHSDYDLTRTHFSHKTRRLISSCGKRAAQTAKLRHTCER